MTTSTVVAFVPDLMDRSRLGFGVDIITFVRELPDVTHSPASGTLLVDLARVAEPESLAAYARAGWRVVAFGSHVDREKLAAAASGGVEVLTRSAFFRDPGVVLFGE